MEAYSCPLGKSLVDLVGHTSLDGRQLYSLQPSNDLHWNSALEAISYGALLLRFQYTFSGL